MLKHSDQVWSAGNLCKDSWHMDQLLIVRNHPVRNHPVRNHPESNAVANHQVKIVDQEHENELSRQHWTNLQSKVGHIVPSDC